MFSSWIRETEKFLGFFTLKFTFWKFLEQSALLLCGVTTPWNYQDPSSKTNASLLLLRNMIDLLTRKRFEQLQLVPVLWSVRILIQPRYIILIKRFGVYFFTFLWIAIWPTTYSWNLLGVKHNAVPSKVIRYGKCKRFTVLTQLVPDLY